MDISTIYAAKSISSMLEVRFNEYSEPSFLSAVYLFAKSKVTRNIQDLREAQAMISDLERRNSSWAKFCAQEAERGKKELNAQGIITDAQFAAYDVACFVRARFHQAYINKEIETGSDIWESNDGEVTDGLEYSVREGAYQLDAETNEGFIPDSIDWFVKQIHDRVGKEFNFLGIVRMHPKEDGTITICLEDLES